jgi:hypothetical protein
MTRRIRHATLLRWTIVLMHTALLVSAGIMLAITVDSTHETTTCMATTAWMMLLDLPVVVLTIPVTPLMSSPSGPVTQAILFSTIFTLLGGLQWYLLASLLARWTCGFQKAMTIASRRFGIALFVGLILVGVCGSIPWTARLERVFHSRNIGRYTPPPVAFSGESEDLRQSVIVPTLDTPLPNSKNAVWCGTLELAWKCLGKDVLHQPPEVQGAEAVASRLNGSQLVEDDLPPDSYLATAGFAKDGIVETLKSEMERRFQRQVEIDALGPNDILAYAYLEAHAAFTIPFFDNREVFPFRDSSAKETNVTSFGIEEKHEYAYRDLRDQIAVLHLLRKKSNPEELEEFVIDLCRDSSPNQIVIACVPPQATLLETLKDMEKKIQAFAGNPNAEYQRAFGVRDVLLVPNLNWEVRHHFTELEGSDKRLLNAGFSGYYMAKAMQTIRFRLDRSGAELASEAQMPCKPMATHFVCDRPFLIVVKKRSAERPFFIMWVDNAELLCKPSGSAK